MWLESGEQATGIAGNGDERREVAVPSFSSHLLLCIYACIHGREEMSVRYLDMYSVYGLVYTLLFFSIRVYFSSTLLYDTIRC
jgi:hypothetical protein